MKITTAALLAFISLPDVGNAFLTRSFELKAVTQSKLRMVDGKEDEEDEEDGPGGSRFKELLAQAQQGQGGGMRPIENPFLTPPAPQPAAPADPSQMSVEEQARMFREMMGQGGAPQQGVQLPSVQRVAKTDTAGRPVGRNRDADTIANTADLYFAQLKRDSSVRNMARMQGDNEAAQQVFEDEGVKALESLIQENPYLKGYEVILEYRGSSCFSFF